MSESLKFLFENVLNHIQKIETWFSRIKSEDEFVNNQDGEVFLNAISLRLQALGENLKKIQKKDPDLLKKYSEIKWDEIIRFRDLISHHYELLDYQIIYRICQTDIPFLKSIIEKILKDSI